MLGLPLRVALQATLIGFAAAPQGAAASTLVYDGPDSTARALEGELDAPPAATALAWSDLRNAAPALRSGAEVAHCAETPLGEEHFADVAVAAEGALAYLEHDEARRLLTSFRHDEPCGAATISPATRARLYWLHALLEQREGNDDAIVAAIEVALTADPASTWDPAWGTTPPQLADAERRLTARVGTTQLTFLPTTSMPPMPLPPGEHLLSVADVGMRVVIEDESADQLVIPQRFPEDGLSWAFDDARRAELSLLLAGVLGEGEAVHIVHGDRVAVGTAGRTDWSEPLASRTPPLPATPDPSPRTWPADLVAVLGLAGTIGGSVATGIASGRARRAADDMTGATSTNAFTEAEQRYQDSAASLRTWRWVAGGSSVTAVAGVGLHFVLAGPSR